MKRPAASSEVHEHCPLGGGSNDDDSQDGFDGSDRGDPDVPKDLKPPKKRPATAAKQKAAAAKTKKKEKETPTCLCSFLVTFVYRKITVNHEQISQVLVIDKIWYNIFIMIYHKIYNILYHVV